MAINKQTKQGLLVGGGALGLILVYRKVHGGGKGGGPVSVTSGQGGQIAPYTPQSPVTLDPGQSVYDPNWQGLVNTPTAPSAGNPPAPQAAAPAAPGYRVNVTYPPATTKTPAARKPVARPKYAPKKAKHTGTKSPGPGWKGIGGGWWAPPKPKVSKPKAKAK